MTLLADLRVAGPMTDDGVGNVMGTWRQAELADLVSALRAEGVLVVEKGEGRNKWPEWVYFNWPTDYPRMGFITATLDGLAEAQPFPPAGG